MREIETRSVPFELTRTDSDGDGRTFQGYAAVFDTPTRIESWEGKFDEQISRGAFKKTLQERTPVLQFDHGTHPMIGSMPIGSISDLREDNRGLFVEGRFSDNWLVQPVADAIRDGGIKGMSIRFSVVKDKWNHSVDVPTRDVKEVKLMELGPVVFPAYQDTHIGVRSRVASLLNDEAARREVARLLLFGDEGQPAEATATADKPQRAPHLSQRVALAQVRKNLERYIA